jgi:hypothetical protein
MEVLQCGLERGPAIEVHSRGELTYVNVGSILLNYSVFVPRYAYHPLRLSLASRLHLFVST